MSEPLLASRGLRAGREAPIAALLDRLAALLDEIGLAGGTPGAPFLRSLADHHRTEGPATAWGPGLARMRAALRLSATEVDLVLLAGLAEEHEGIGNVLMALHPRSEPLATAALAAQLLGAAIERRALRDLLETGALRRSGTVDLAGEGPFFHRSLTLCPGLWSVLRGGDVWPAGVRVDGDPVPSLGLEGWLDTEPCRRARAWIEADEPATVVLWGTDPDAVLWRGAALAAAAGRRALRIRLDGGESRAERTLVPHLLARDALPVVWAGGGDGAGAPGALELVPGPLLLCGAPEDVRSPHGRPALALSAEPLSPRSRSALWRGLLPELAEEASRFAAAYTLEPGAAAAVAADVRAAARIEGRAPTAADVAASVRSRCHVASGAGLVVRRPRAGWDHLVLPPDRLAQLRDAVERLERQATVLDEWGFLEGRPGARGVRVLLAGPPGTGKTLAAEVLAQALGVDLLVVDLSRVLSKWLGDTEKHLAGAFDAAERAQAVLLFDEADALFARRTDVGDANSRYANVETSYLLYRLERFEGLAALSTNLKRNIDPAFLRRLEFVIDIEEPDAAARLELWRRHIPPATPLADDADLRELAAIYPISGGLIRNAAVAAAFRAAATDSPVDRRLLVHAVRREYQKAGRAFPGFPPGVSEN